MTHVGMCAQDGPERKAGEIHVRLSRLFSSMKATLLMDGVECSYSATLTDSYNGLMECPGRRAVPMMVWVK